jgi:hypothetical protein
MDDVYGQSEIKKKKGGEWWTVNGHLKYSKRFQNDFVSLAFFPTAERQLHFSIFLFFDSLPALCDPRNPLSSQIRIKKVLACFVVFLFNYSFLFVRFFFVSFVGFHFFHEPKKLPDILTFSLGPPKPPRL